jgi:hypothetical protein
MNISRIVPKIESGYLAPVLGCGDGGYGLAIQQAYDARGIPTNYGPGNDIPEMNVEIKSWDKTKNGHISIASSTSKVILKTNGEVFLQKLKKWNLHLHEAGVLKDVRIYDFSPIHPQIKQELKELVQQLAQEEVASPKSEHFILEKIKGRNSFKLRLKFNKAENLFSMSKSDKQFNNLFEEA